MNLFELVGHIFMNSMVPILVLIGVGFILDRRFKLDLYTLSKLNLTQVPWKLYSVRSVYSY